MFAPVCVICLPLDHQSFMEKGVGRHCANLVTVNHVGGSGGRKDKFPECHMGE